MLRAGLEYGPVLAFRVAYLWLKDNTYTFGGTEYDGFIVVTAMFVPLLVLSTGALWALTGKLSRMQVATVVLVVIFGGLSVWLNDPRFFKMKPTIIYLLFAAILGYSLVARRNWLQAVLSEALPMDALGWRKLTMRMMLLFLGLALANEFVWRMMSETSWVYFKTFGLPLILFVFLIANAGLYRAHAVESEKDDEQG